MEPVEQEFNLEQYPHEYVVVGDDELMPSVLERVEDSWTRTPNAVLIIPRSTLAFRNTHDFLALGKLQDSRDVRISIASHDPIVTGLARVLGFYLIDPPPDHPALANEPIAGSAPGDAVEQPTAPLPLGITSTTQIAPDWVIVPTSPPTSSTTSTWLSNAGDASVYPEIAHPPWPPPRVAPSHRSDVPQPLTQMPQTEQLPTLNMAVDSLHMGASRAQAPATLTPTGPIKARRAVPEGKQESARFRYGGRSKQAVWGKLLAIVVISLLVILVGGSAYAYIYLPEATVSVTPLSETISDLHVEISVIISPRPGQGSNPNEVPPQLGPQNLQTGPTITAAWIHSPLTEEGTRPSSGSRQILRGKGQGTMHFTNRTSNPVNVPAGMQFKAPNGVIVQIAQGGTVPPTNFESQLFGTLDLPVAATIAGPDGNVGAKQIEGTWNGTLSYTNSTLQGGSVDTIKVIKQEDIDSLVAELRAKAENQSASAVLGMVNSGQQLITQTIALADATFTPDHKAGEDGDSVHVKFTAQAQAYAYKESELRDSVAQAMLDSVQSTIPSTVGPNLDLGSVQYLPPQLQAREAGRVTYRTSASGRVTFALTPELATQIRTLIKGKAISQARNLISQNYSPYLSPDSIEAKVLWFTLNTLPNDPSHIDVQPSSARSQP